MSEYGDNLYVLGSGVRVRPRANIFCEFFLVKVSKVRVSAGQVYIRNTGLEANVAINFSGWRTNY